MAEVKIEIGAVDKASGVFRDLQEKGSSAFEKIKSSALDFFKAMVGFEALKAGVRTLKDLMVGTLNVASSYEQYEFRLSALLGSQEAAADAMKRYMDYASQVPHSLEDIIEAGVGLEAFGAKSEEWMAPLGDLAFVMGVTLPEAAAALGRAYSGGAGAADIFRERGILNIIKDAQGIKDLSKTTLPEFRQAMLNTFTDPDGKIAGAAGRAADTWDGTISMIQDAWFKFRKMIMDSGAFDALKSAAKDLKVWLDDAFNTGKIKAWARDISSVVSGAVSTFKGLIVVVSSAVDAVKTLKDNIYELSLVLGTVGVIAFSAQIAAGVTALGTFAAGLLTAGGAATIFVTATGALTTAGLGLVGVLGFLAAMKIKKIFTAGPAEELRKETEKLAETEKRLAEVKGRVKQKALEKAKAQEVDKAATEDLIAVVEKYADAIKGVNADLLKFAGADFTKNLKDQEKSTDGMKQALQGYLNITDAVYNKRLQMLFVLGQETDMELQSTAMQKAQAEARLGAWSQYYETLNGAHNAAIEAQKTKTKELLDLETQIKDQRQGYADLTLSLNQKLMTETQKYYSTQKDLEEKYKSALTLTGKAKIDALTNYQTAMAATATAVTENGEVQITLEKTVATALKNTATAQEEILKTQDALKEAKQAEIEQIGVWKTSLETAMAKATEMMELYKAQITGFGGQIDALNMAKTLTVDTKGAIDNVNSLKAAIDSIDPITYKQVVITTVGGSSTGSSSGDGFQSDSSMSGFHPQPLATGTPYVKNDGLFYLHKGEAVIPASQNNNNSRKTTISISAPIQIIGSDKDGKQLAREIDAELANMIKNKRSKLVGVLK